MTSFAFILGVVPLVISAGRRRRDAADAGHGRLQRHARRDPVRHLPHAGLLLRDPVGQRHSHRAPPRAGLFAETTQNGRPYQDAPANGHPRPSHHGEEFDGDDDGVGDGAIGHPSAHDEDLLATGAEIGE